MTDISTKAPDEELEEHTDTPEELSAEDRAIEQRARGMGWHPFAEYRGPPGKWVPADVFVERGETVLPIMRANNRRLEEKVEKQNTVIEDLKRTVGEQKQVLEEMRDFARRSDERGYQRALAEVEAKREAAIDAGDRDAFKQADAELKALEQGHADRPKVDTAPPPVPRAEQPKIDPAVLAFVEANPWFNTNPRLNAKMVAEHLDVMSDYPEMALAEQLELAASNLKERHPQMFGSDPTPAPRPRPRAPSVSAPSSSAPARRQPATGIDSIADPEERKQARGAFERMKRQLPDYTEAEYMAVYDNPHSDVIAMRRASKGATNVRA